MRRPLRNKEPKSLPECSQTEDSGLESEEPQQKAGTNDSKALPLLVKLKKAALRSLIGTMLMAAFGYIIYLGHACVCILVFFLQCCLFGELVSVRKRTAKEAHLPLFRSMQWAWFLLAAFYTWADGVLAFIRENPIIEQAWNERLNIPQELSGFKDDVWKVLIEVLKKNTFVAFSMYSTLMIISVLTLRKGSYRYQISQYCWTLTTCCLVLVQTRAVFQMIYAGLYWFVVPCWLVICNDISAYFCGQLFGRVFIKRPFLEISPNKTWEGFFGGAVCTFVFAWYLSAFCSQFESLVCVPKDLAFLSGPLTCEIGALYKKQIFPAVIEDMFPTDSLPRLAVLMKNGLLAFHTESGFPGASAAPVQIFSLALASFASFVAPFGGFLASAIKRAYGIKDFNNILPGHGGVMDRFDCQLIMMMFTYVLHYNYCRISTSFSVDALLVGIAQLNEQERQELVRKLQTHGLL